jgi:transcriptional regulator with XRE-family HTH domain/uncharacterized cupin superfamily protein
MIGEVLRKARKSRLYTMSEVAAMVGVTTGYISNLEKNRLEPSLTLLRELSDKLGIPASTLISEDAVDLVTVVKRTQRPRLRFGNLPYPCEVLTPLNWHCMKPEELEAVSMTVPPGAVVNLDSLSGDTDICVYVLSGEMTYRYGGNDVTVYKDGSLFIPRHSGHRIENTGTGDTVMIWLAKTLTSVRPIETDIIKEEKTAPPEGESSRLQLLGERIRDLRKAHGFGVRAFSEIVGVTPAYISQIERNMTEPSLRVLRSIAKTLNVELTLLFASDMPSDILVTAHGGRGVMTIADGNARFQLMMPYHTADGRSPDMSVVLVEIGAGQADSDESIVHDYDEVCILLEGSVEYQTPEGNYALEEGDCLYIRKGIHHTIFNKSGSDARMLAVLGSVFRRRFH